MSDISSIAATLQGIKTATEIAKSLRNIDFSIEKAELKLKIAELTSALADAKIGFSEIQSSIIYKDKEINNLKEKLYFKENFIFEEEFYFLHKNNQKIGPYCHRCYDGDQKIVHLVSVRSYRGCYYCNVCNNHFGEANAQPPNLTI